MITRTITATEMRGINRSAILELIRRESPISRTAIAERLDISLATVLRIVDGLVEEGLVRPHGSTEWSGGRRRTLLEFNADSRMIIGVDLGGVKMYGAVANVGGRILHEASLDGDRSSGDQSFESLAGLIRQLLDAHSAPGRRTDGIAVGAPGVTCSQPGVVKWAASLNWREYPLKQKLETRFDLPVLVDNDVNLAVLGEHWFGAGQGVNNMVLITVGTGVGAGILIDGVLYRGHTESSGEIGYLVPGREWLGKRYESFGPLEDITSGTGIAQRVKPLPCDVVGLEDPSTLTFSDVLDAARRGREWAVRIVDEVADYLSMAVVDVAAVLDPELIVLAGGVVADSAGLLIERVRRAVDGLVPSMPRLEASTLGRHAAVLGAVVLVLHATAGYYVVRRPS